MNILVTGGAGYVGSTLVPMLLAEGHRVRVCDSLRHGAHSLLGVWSHPHFELLRGDIRDPATRERALEDMAAVVHLAAIVGDPACARAPDEARAVNLDASLALIEESERKSIQRFVFASTCSNYGRMQDDTQYVDEESALMPLSLYAETKVVIEHALLDAARRGTLCATPLRFATVFGVSPRMRFDLTVNEFTAAMVTQKRLTVFGEQFWRPYVHVTDAARAIVTVLRAPAATVAGVAFNVGCTEQNYQKRQLVDLIRPYAPDACVDYVKKIGDPRDYRVSFARIRTRLGFEVTVTVPQGIREVVRLMQDGAMEDWGDARYHN